MAMGVESLIAGLDGVECARNAQGRVVLSPGTVEEVAAVTRAANERGVAIEIAGAGTKRGWGNPVDAQIVLSAARLNGVREHSWQDLTATVGAGTTWAAMQQELAKHGQFVALDPLWPETATVGGVIATNDSGALRLRYGSLRDLIIGMTIVLADGTIAKSGGKVVKNVAGYDLHKLMTGAFGTLGVIVEVTFRLHPVAAHTRVWSVASQDADALGEVMMKVLDSHLSMQAMQMCASAEGYALDVELASLPEVLTTQMEQLRRLAHEGAPMEAAEVQGIFNAREALFRGDALVVKMTMVPGAIARLSREVVKLGGTAVTQAVGIMFARFEDATTLSALRELVEAEESAALVVLQAPTVLQAPDAISRAAEEVAPAGGPRAAARSALIEEIKRQFDAKRTLNPGRFVGEI